MRNGKREEKIEKLSDQMSEQNVHLSRTFSGNRKRNNCEKHLDPPSRTEIFQQPLEEVSIAGHIEKA